MCASHTRLPLSSGGCTNPMHNNCFHRSGGGKTPLERDEREMERVRNIAVFSPQLNCLSNPSQQVTQFICLKSIRSSRCESLSQHKTGPLIILFRVLSPDSSRLSLIFSYFQSIIIFYPACTPPWRQMCVFTSRFRESGEKMRWIGYSYDVNTSV